PNCGYEPKKDAESYPLALRPGSILDGRYIVGRVLGEGGFGITYAAMDYDSRRLLAIKEYYPAFLVTRVGGREVSVINASAEEAFHEGKKNFLAEAKLLSRFNGIDNICDIYSYFEENGTAYFSMEFVQGKSLKDYLGQRGGRLDWQETLELLMPLMQALCRIHDEGVIHRDIAPDNIMVTAEGKVMLIDFGAARYALGLKSQSLDVILKHGFAPMEQYARRGRQGPFTDIYALAATMYYVISGRLPEDSVERSGEDTLQSLSRLGIPVPDYFDKALMKALGLRPEDRYSCMQDFIAALQPPAGKAAAGEKKKVPKLLLLAAAALALVAALLLMPEKKPEQEPAPTSPPAAVTAAPSMEPLPIEQPDTKLKWELSDDGTLTVSAQGSMEENM
ncbi:MAG: serine/threonine-protein kinase, partial [Eubacteriales bacterium]|nr:serine/threonine-protein kinase [Eubacteriales bacterium]